MTVTIVIIVLAVIVGALAVALFLQAKNAKKQNEDREQIGRAHV